MCVRLCEVRWFVKNHSHALAKSHRIRDFIMGYLSDGNIQTDLLIK